jgi:hypothetical protein
MLVSFPAKEEAEPVLIIMPAAAHRRRGRHPSLLFILNTYVPIVLLVTLLDLANWLFGPGMAWVAVNGVSSAPATEFLAVLAADMQLGVHV